LLSIFDNAVGVASSDPAVIVRASCRSLILRDPASLQQDVNSAVKATAHGTNHSAEFENICRLQMLGTAA